MMTSYLAQEILLKLKSARLVGLAMHRGPDADSMGSAAAFAAFLDTHGIPFRFYCVSGIPRDGQFFGIDKRNFIGPDELARTPFDYICTFDAGDIGYVGLDEGANYESIANLRISNSKIRKFEPHSQFAPPFIVNFDHHATNTRFGNLNVVDTGCASTTELMYEFFKMVKWPIPARTAGHLLSGLLNDTDQFSNPATSGSSFAMAGELLSRGITLSAIRGLLFERRGIKSLKLIGEVLARLRLNSDLGIAVTYIDEADFARYEITDQDLEGIANILNAVGEAKATLLLMSRGGMVKGSFRTTRDDIDVGRMAISFGGGGHRKAAGFRIRGALQIEGNNVTIL